jgi:squalene-hopene/tetraprenyl-beta-curcumene cyclase
MNIANPDRSEIQAFAVADAIAEGLQWLEGTQKPEGFWAGMLETNACIEAEWLLAMHFLGIEDDPKKPGIMRALLDTQRPDGSWQVYYGAQEGDINATVESYVALRACGLHADTIPLRRARQWIFDHGGLGNIRVFTRYWLALLGEWPWDQTPNIPPEMITFPSWFPFNIYNLASWARATIVPISILSARRACRPLPPSSRLDELFPEGRGAVDYGLPKNGHPLSWTWLFLVLDRGLHAYQRLGLTPGREWSIKACLEWIIKHQDADGAWGGIQPPWIYSLLALHVEGYPLTHSVVHRGLDALNHHWSYEKEGRLHIQASESPVWDTLLSLLAMEDCGEDYRRSPMMHRGVSWVLAQQVKAPGDWQVKVTGVAPGGWAFERANLSYPDVDDTAVALMVLARLRRVYEDRVKLEEAIDLAKDWIVAMQSKNGGWGAFDKDNESMILTRFPFCDFGEILDPPSVDVTAHVIEALGLLGLDHSHPIVRRALGFIRSEQESDGSWFGRWGVNHIYGTGAVLPALKAVGEDMRAGYVRKAGFWLLDRQNDDGGWGETCGSYMDCRLRGQGPSTASQTAWALLGLLALDSEEYRGAIEWGVDYLVTHQREGTWEEPEYTGAGFPGYCRGARIDLEDEALSEKVRQGTELSRGYMINYNMYRHYFPLMALGRAQRFLGGRKNILSTIS